MAERTVSAVLRAEVASYVQGLRQARQETANLGKTAADTARADRQLAQAMAAGTRDVAGRAGAATTAATAEGKLAAAEEKAAAAARTGTQAAQARGGAALRVEAAQLQVEKATRAAAAAEQKYGAGSLQARDAGIRLAQAQDRLAEATAGASAETQGLFERLHANRDAAQTLGRGLLAFGGAVAAGLGVAAKAAIDWETAWAGVQKTVNGTVPQMAALEQELRNLTTTLPASHEQIAAVAEAAGQLGIQRNAVAGFTKTMVDLGETTNLSADEAATAMARLANIMAIPQTEIDRLGATLVALGNDGASTEAEIVQMALRIAGAGKTIGLTAADVFGFANALSSVGVEAEAGGSAISRVMVDIAQSVETADDKLATFARVAGMSVEDFTTAFRTDAAGAIVSFVEGLGRMQASGQNLFGTLDELELSEIRVRDALLRAASAGDLQRNSIELGSRAWEDNTALVDEANKRYETAASRIQVARNQIRDAAIDIGGTLAPAVAFAAETAGGLGKAFADLPGPVQTTGTVIGGVASAASLAGGAFFLAAPKIIAFRESLTQLGPRGQAAGKALTGVGSVLTGPWGLAIAGGITALGIFAARHADAKREVDALTEAIKADGNAIGEHTREVVVARLEQEGLLKVAQEMGVNTKDLVEALLGNADAQDQVNQQLAKFDKPAQDAAKRATDLARGAHDLGGESNALTQGLEAQTEATFRQASAADALRGKLHPLQEQLDAARESAKREADASGEAADETAGLGSSAAGAAGSVSDLGGAVGDTTGELEDQKKAVDDLKDALDDLNDANIAAMDAEIGYQDALADANERLGKRAEITAEIRDKQAELAKTDDPEARKRLTEDIAALNKELAGYAGGLDVTTEAGRRNSDALLGIAEAAQERAQALLDEGKSEAEFRASLAQSRAALIAMAEKFGLSKQEAKEFADQVLQIPDPSAELQAYQDELARVAEWFGLSKDEAAKFAEKVTAIPPADLAESRAELEATAVKFGLSKDAAKAFVDQVLAVPPVASTTVSAPGAKESGRQVRSLHERLYGLPTDVKSNVSAPGAREAFSDAKELHRWLTQLDGMSVEAAVILREQSYSLEREHLARAPKQAGGILTGGTPGRDSVPILGMPGEFVVREPVVSKPGMRPFLEALNAGAEPARMADGGTVAAAAFMPTRRDHGRPYAAVASPAGRPGLTAPVSQTTHNETNIAQLVAHDYRDFRRQLDRERVVAGLPGGGTR